MREAIKPDVLRDRLPTLCASDPLKRAQMIAELQSMSLSRLLPTLQQLLSDADCDMRCYAALAVFHVAPQEGLSLLLSLLDDAEVVVRWHTCGLLHDIADKRAVEPLIHIMKTDPDPQVRNTAAYALGGVGDPWAIPALIETLDKDHEVDDLGHCASSSAATALDDILQTNHTRIKLADDLCTMQRKQLDLGLLKTEAMELYQRRSEKKQV
jgi:HEAT repeat protein